MTAAIILAAGASSRLGEPKQNLVFKGKTLLQIAVDAAKRSGCDPVIVVLGANSDKIAPPDGTTILYNQDWEKGMASSIRMAINEIVKDDTINDALLMLCDQPFVSKGLIDEILQKKTRSKSTIVACSYQNTIGVPALFARSLFPELLALSGNEGAKKIIISHANDVSDVPFDLGIVDIDTPEDYERLITRSH